MYMFFILNIWCCLELEVIVTANVFAHYDLVDLVVELDRGDADPSPLGPQHVHARRCNRDEVEELWRETLLREERRDAHRGVVPCLDRVAHVLLDRASRTVDAALLALDAQVRARIHVVLCRDTRRGVWRDEVA